MNLKRHPVESHAVEGHSESPDICFLHMVRAALKLATLWREEEHGAFNGSGDVVIILNLPSFSEICKDERGVFVHQNVLGLNISMNNFQIFMQMFQSTEQLLGHELERWFLIKTCMRNVLCLLNFIHNLRLNHVVGNKLASNPIERHALPIISHCHNQVEFV